LEDNVEGKGFLQSKTIIINVIAMAILVLGNATELIPIAYLPYQALGLGVLNLFLRFLTGEPLEFKPVVKADK